MKVKQRSDTSQTEDRRRLDTGQTGAWLGTLRIGTDQINEWFNKASLVKYVTPDVMLRDDIFPLTISNRCGHMSLTSALRLAFMEHAFALLSSFSMALPTSV